MLQTIDETRQKISTRTSSKHKSELGQFMTPSSVARFMASLFSKSPIKNCRLLDAGAGIGTLSCAFLDRWVAGDFSFDSVEVTAYELDDRLKVHLEKHLAHYKNVTSNVIAGDYIKLATSYDLFTKKKNK